jgi:ribonuclease BN (tRNA processing enzyme)
VGDLRVKFWGTRGLISSPGYKNAIFGGNTPCIQILHENHLIICDTGFGISLLGETLLEKIVRENAALHVHILFTHFHWDHIQGLPFFQPIYFPNTTIDIHSPESVSLTLENLDILFDGSYSPFDGLLKMPAKININQIHGTFDIGGLKIEYHPVDHGSHLNSQVAHETYAFKFTNQSGESVLLLTDHEAKASKVNSSLIHFGKNVDLLIHDAQFLENEYVNAYEGWGHSTAEQALENARRIGSEMTLLTHHHPKRTDQQILDTMRQLAKNKRFQDLNFEFAREETTYHVKRLQNKIKKAG